jgi:hypothetical protein
VRSLRVFQVGNFEPPHSTENHLREALLHNGHEVFPFNERPDRWAHAAEDLRLAHEIKPVDFLLWTSTSGYAPPETYSDQHKLLTAAADMGIPTVGYWFPPGIVESECRVGTPSERYEADVAFVGSWNGYGHRESTHRFQLVDHLREKWNARFWPEPGKPRIDGAQLRDLMASTKVMVGDSAMVPRLKRYWSDRVPNTTGRGCFLLHPDVEGLTEQHPGLATWEAGDWQQLDAFIGYWLDRDDQRLETARLCMADTIEHHTYEVRLKQLVTLLAQKGLL